MSIKFNVSTKFNNLVFSILYLKVMSSWHSNQVFTTPPSSLIFLSYNCTRISNFLSRRGDLPHCFIGTFFSSVALLSSVCLYLLHSFNSSSQLFLFNCTVLLLTVCFSLLVKYGWSIIMIGILSNISAKLGTVFVIGTSSFFLAFLYAKRPCSLFGCEMAFEEINKSNLGSGNHQLACNIYITKH